MKIQSSVMLLYKNKVYDYLTMCGWAVVKGLRWSADRLTV